MRMLAAALAATLLATPALADFEFVESKSDFDGTVTKVISLDGKAPHGAVLLWSPSPANIIKSTYYSIAWQPRDAGYICGAGTDDIIAVRWLHVDESGAINKVTTLPVIFKLRDGKEILDISTDKNVQNEASVVAMFEAFEKPGAVRVTFTDSCGKTTLEDLPTKGFSEALAKYRSK